MKDLAKYVVRKVNSNGKFSKARPSRFNFCLTLEMAIMRRGDLEKANPHLQYDIDTL